ncbi:MAG: ABC transporter ATP-binding protein [Rhodospirillaceae bacterium]|nr:ABC transporter ATP-binding protein [Rhodospirillaceae bacterium]|tara:strand:- start:7748 stop:8524 length:777 start_codon:yes stop_codon:yes gene_type:complete
MTQRFKDPLPPLLIGIAILLGWEAAVRLFEVPHYVLPGPLMVMQALWSNAALLFGSLWITLEITLVALLAAALGGAALAFVMSRARWLERSLMPYAIIAQVTPIVAIAPLIIIWVDSPFASLVLCAWIVAFFPILSNTMTGLKSADPYLKDLFRLYGASRWQTQAWLEAPTALPYFFAGLRISGGLALIGAVVAEFVAGTGGAATGLAFRILEAGYRLQIPKLFAALLLLSLVGILIYAFLNILSKWALQRWHGTSTL